MKRLLLALGLLTVVVALLAGGVSVLAYGPDAPRDGSLEVAGVSAPVTLAWADAGGVDIEAATLPDLALGLGYAHAADHAWTMVLWRQTARGGLSEWFGARSRRLDRHARTLGFDALAQETYRTLDGPTRDVLEAYARGVNAALAEPGVAQGDAFVLLDVEAEAWRPWDALTVERLIAYLATPALSRDSTWRAAAAQDSSLAAFADADSTYRAALGIGGTDGARAFAIPADEGLAFVAHQTAGASALDLFAPAALRLAGRTTSATTIPGTLSLPMGWTGEAGWSVFLTSPIEVAPFTGPLPAFVHSRIVERDGDESLLTIPRDSTGLVLEARVLLSDSLVADSLVAETAPSDSVATRPDEAMSEGWRLRWPGLRPGTDVPAFLALLRGEAPASFALLRGDGLRVGDGGLLGSPPAARVEGALQFAGASEAAQRAPAVLARFRARADTSGVSMTARSLAASDASLWAAQTLRPLLRALGDRDSLDLVLDAPYAFLRGWDYRYTPDAIAPSIFETWLDAHEAYTGHAPDVADSLDVLLLPYTLRIARAQLRDRYGPDVIDWQWGLLQGGLDRPVASGRDGSVFARRFPTAESGPGGHPTSLFPGPDLEGRDAGGGSATWSVWATTGSPLVSVRPPAVRRADQALVPESDPRTIFRLGTSRGGDRPRLTLVSPS